MSLIRAKDMVAERVGTCTGTFVHTQAATQSITRRDCHVAAATSRTPKEKLLIKKLFILAGDGVQIQPARIMISLASKHGAQVWDLLRPLAEYDRATRFANADCILIEGSSMEERHRGLVAG